MLTIADKISKYHDLFLAAEHTCIKIDFNEILNKF